MWILDVIHERVEKKLKVEEEKEEGNVIGSILKKKKNLFNKNFKIYWRNWNRINM